MIVIGGIMLYFGGAKPELIGRAKTLFKSVGTGLFLIYGAFMVLGVFLTVLGAADMSPVKNIFQNGVFSINCPIRF